MKWKLKSGKDVNFNPIQYKLINWNEAPSGPQLKVQKFFYPFWKNDIVLSEMRLPRTLWRFDLVNLSRKIIVETSPDAVHLEYNEFMHGSRAGFSKKIKADYEKMQLAELNGFKFIELNDEHLINLTKTMFKEIFDLTL
jgi:hypothetical protein